ncbi:MAG: POTRA domain-containing protein [Polyangiaceae bacterium]
MLRRAGLACLLVVLTACAPQPKPSEAPSHEQHAAPDATPSATTPALRASSSATEATAPSPPKVSVFFVGNAHVDEADLRAVMKATDPASVAINGLDVLLERDVLYISSLYMDRGFIDVTVDAPNILPEERGETQVRVTIHEGIAYKLGKVDLVERDDQDKEITPLETKKALLARLTIKSPEVFSRTKFGEFARQIHDLYSDAGYAAVEVLPSLEQKRKSATVDVEVLIRRHQIWYFDTVNVVGNVNVPAATILGSITVVPGNRFSLSAIEESKRRLEATGQFSRVDVAMERGARPNLMKLNIEVTER